MVSGVALGADYLFMELVALSASIDHFVAGSHGPFLEHNWLFLFDFGFNQFIGSSSAFQCCLIIHLDVDKGLVISLFTDDPVWFESSIGLDVLMALSRELRVPADLDAALETLLLCCVLALRAAIDQLWAGFA